MICEIEANHGKGTCAPVCSLGRIQDAALGVALRSFAGPCGTIWYLLIGLHMVYRDHIFVFWSDYTEDTWAHILRAPRATLSAATRSQDILFCGVI